MYGHCHSGIGAIILTLVAIAKGGFGFLFRFLGHAHH